MGKIKILKNNKKSKFMIISLIVFSFFYALFGVLMLFSPAVSTAGFDEINAFYTDPSQFGYEYKKIFGFLDFFLFEKETKKFIFAPTATSIIYAPIIIGGLIFTIMLIRIIIHSVGYKNQNKKGIARIVRPIKSYQCTIILSWICFILLTIWATISFFAASPFQMGVVWEFNIKGAVNSCSHDILDTIENSPYFSNKKQFYWPTMAWFSEGYILSVGEKVWLKWFWIFVPTLIFLPLVVITFIGTILGECSWWTINLAVLRDIDATTGTNLAAEYDHVEAPSLKKSKKLKLVDSFEEDQQSLEPYVTEDDNQIEILEENQVEALNRVKAAADQEVEALNRVKAAANEEVEALRLAKLAAEEEIEALKQAKIAANEEVEALKRAKRVAHEEETKLSKKTKTQKTIENITLDSNNARVLNFFKSLIKLLELSKNTSIPLYNEAQTQLKSLQSKNKRNHWDYVYEVAEEEFFNLTRTDQKFVGLIENVISNSRNNIFGRYKDDVKTLIIEYKKAIRVWDVYEAEAIIEQIFTIASRSEELLGKVGFCLRERLVNNFKHIELNENIIAKMNRAKDREDINSYRELCLDAIAKMSPIKSKISSYANKIIYN